MTYDADDPPTTGTIWVPCGTNPLTENPEKRTRPDVSGNSFVTKS
jgi:hypothetical protein